MSRRILLHCIATAVLTIVAICPMPQALGAENAAADGGFLKPLYTLWDGFKAKVHRMAAVDQLNEQLHARVAELEILNEHLAYDAMQEREESRAETVVKKNVEEGGTPAARTIASVESSDPLLLSKPPKAVFEAASAAFEKGDYETAVTGFVFLANNQENQTYQRPQVFFLAGISLFKLSNYKTAKKYLGRAIASAVALGEQSDDLAYAPRAMAWEALADEKLGDKESKQATIHELIQKYPKSAEARRLNGKN